MLAQAHRLRGLAWLAAGQHESAQQELTLALTLAEQIGQVRLAWECLRALARVAAARGDENSKAKHEARARAFRQNSQEFEWIGFDFESGCAMLRGARIHSLWMRGDQCMEE